MVVYEGQKSALATSNLRDELSIYIIPKFGFPPVDIKLFTSVISFYPARSFNIDKTIVAEPEYRVSIIKYSPQRGVLIEAKDNEKEIRKWVRHKDEHGSSFEFERQYINVKFLPLKHTLEFNIYLQKVESKDKPQCKIVLTGKRKQKTRTLKEGDWTLFGGYIIKVVRIEKDRVTLKIYNEPVFLLLPLACQLIAFSVIGKLLEPKK
jgi:hypothetical protein